MAAHNGAHALAVAAAALLLFASLAAAAGSVEGTATKVDVALYYESLCPYSARFVVNHLAKVFNDGLLDAIDLTLLPYGNARVGAGGKISCQVGVPSFLIRQLLSIVSLLPCLGLGLSQLRVNLFGILAFGVLSLVLCSGSRSQNCGFFTVLQWCW